MRILVTNDDGIDAAGLPPLVESLAAAGNEVVVAAPAQNVSGASAAIGRIDPGLRIGTTVRADFSVGAEAVIAVDGPPGVAVLGALLGAFGEPPDLVVSGINAGANTGNAILHSGTVGAVLTARNFGVSGLAVSLDEGNAWHWETAAALATQAAHLFTAGSIIALNLNCPCRPPTDQPEMRWARLARGGTVRAVAASRRDGSLEFEFGEPAVGEAADTDVSLLAAGYATITALSGVSGWALTEERVDARAVARAVAALAADTPDLEPMGRYPTGT